MTRWTMKIELSKQMTQMLHMAFLMPHTARSSKQKADHCTLDSIATHSVRD